ncbi:MAG TPA: cytochrome b/b6 domain-containing protein [Terriglobia bacterium]|nr:cytochrome b/b6 domain-containing protein [Terriglobia bacterium]
MKLWASNNEEDLCKEGNIDPRQIVSDDEVFIRMTLAERLQHVTLITCFLVLVLTGLPLLFDPTVWLQRMFFFEGSFNLRGIIHRTAGVGLILLSLFHIGYMTSTRRGRANLLALIPKLKDITDAFESFNYNLGLTTWLHRKGVLRAFFQAHPYWLFQKPPKYGRYNFIEKFEYLALLWGTLVMIVTGFFLWANNLTFRIFPVWVFDIFRIVHSYEAILAFLSIIIWHLYNVHLNPEVFPMSRIWIDGKITGHELRTLHALEYEELVKKRHNESRL